MRYSATDDYNEPRKECVKYGVGQCKIARILDLFVSLNGFQDIVISSAECVFSNSKSHDNSNSEDVNSSYLD